MKRVIKSVLNRVGYDIVPFFPPDFEARHIDIIRRVEDYTLTSRERLYALIEAVRHMVRNGVPGSFVECGVFRGGSMMTVALTLLSEGVKDRDLYLFDSYEGMPKPDARDVDLHGKPAIEEFSKRRLSDASSTWAQAPLDGVKAAMASTGYPESRIHFVKGLVEQTIPAHAPDTIALLRLDTDWYQSTMHEMVHLYDRVSAGGVVIVDDYGHFKGAKDAVDEFLATRGLAPLLHRIDYTARLIVKP